MENEHLSMLITQTWQVTVLIVMVWITVRICATNRPHLAHALWVLVLFKCVTPPIWSSPASPFSWLNTSSHVARATSPSPNSSAGNVIEDDLVAPIATPAESFRDRSDVIVVHVNRDQVPNRSANGSLSRTASRSDAESPSLYFNWQSWLILIWVSGVLLGFMTTLLRFGCFVAWLRSKATTADPQINAILQRLSRRLKIKRKVRVLLADQPVGPAVFGLIRPTILLPVAIVGNKTAEELEPLLAHELIHVRRGDLWWAMLQTLATSLFWFHPLVWLAVKMVTRESERSCDEETVASLGCPPATYARGLLEILEQKHRLRVAPALPGVRPVDITSARLERVMKLGNGCHRRTPVWIWLVMFLCGAWVLPGAAFVLAQDTAQRLPETNQPLLDSLYLPPGQKLPAIPAELKVEVHDVSILLARIREADVSDRSPEDLLIQLLPLSDRPSVNGVIENPPLQVPRLAPPVPQAKNNDLQPRVRIEDGKLTIHDSAEQCRLVAERLAEFHKFGFQQIVVETKMITMPPQHMKELGVDWTIAPTGDAGLFAIERKPTEGLDASKPQVLPTSDDFKIEEFERLTPAGVVSSSYVVAKNRPVVYALIDDQQSADLIQHSIRNTNTNVLQAPTVTMFNGQTASIRDGGSQPFVVGVERVADQEAGKFAYQPIIKIILNGNAVNLKTEIQDEATLKLKCELVTSQIRGVETMELPTPAGEGPVQIQVPEVETTTIRSSLEIQTTQTLVLNSLILNAKGEKESLLVMLRCRVMDTFPKKVSASSPAAALEVQQIAATEDLPACEFASPQFSAETMTFATNVDDFTPLSTESDSNVIFIRAGEVSADKEEMQIIEVLGQRLHISGDVSCKINQVEASFTGKDLSVQFDGDEFVGSGSEGDIHLERDSAGEISLTLKLRGNAKLKMQTTSLAGDSIDFGVSEERGEFLCKIDGAGTLTTTDAKLSANSIRVAEDDEIIMEGEANLILPSDDKEPPLDIRANGSAGMRHPMKSTRRSHNMKNANQPTEATGVFREKSFPGKTNNPWKN